MKQDTKSRRLCHEDDGCKATERQRCGTMVAIMQLLESQILHGAHLRVTVYPTDVSDYTAQVYSGLFELEARGELSLSFRRHTDQRLFAPHTVYLELDTPGLLGTRRLLIDLIDSAVLQAPQALTLVDCYAKRSLRVTTETVSSDVRFIPYGLHYAARSASMSARRQAELHWRATYRGGQPYGLRRKVGVAMQAGSRMLRRRSALSVTAPMQIEAFEGARIAKTPQIFFATRVYGPNEAPLASDREVANETRVNLVRALRANFGVRYAGGLRPSAHALANYADCVVVNPDNRLWHHRTGLASLVHVNSAGLHGSTGWKFAEALAQSSCLVSEPSLDRQPGVLRDGEQFLAFNTVDQCVGHCENLLLDSRRAEELRHRGHDYYLRYIRPESLMRECLADALAITDQATSSRFGEKSVDVD